MRIDRLTLYFWYVGEYLIANGSFN